jgi:hypothetical protein
MGQHPVIQNPDTLNSDLERSGQKYIFWGSENHRLIPLRRTTLYEKRSALQRAVLSSGQLDADPDATYLPAAM